MREKEAEDVYNKNTIKFEGISFNRDYGFWIVNL
jgi:hypothetical protein